VAVLLNLSKPDWSVGHVGLRGVTWRRYPAGVRCGQPGLDNQW
jgi:hypothetical protein